MKISEVEKGSMLVVKVFAKIMKDGMELKSQRSVDFSVNIQKIYSTAIAVDEIKTAATPGDKSGKSMITVGFQSKNAIIDLYLYEGDSPPIVWENVTIKHARGDKGPCHVIIPSKDGEKLNRRHAFRLEVHAPASIFIGRARMQIDGIVRDVSSNGFSIITSKKDIRGNEEIRAEMTDEDKVIVMSGVCVRKREVSDGRYLYGCKMKFDNPELRKYINQKQRQRLKTN